MERELLPPDVRAKISRQIKRAAAEASKNFHRFVADERLVAGALLGTMEHGVHGTFAEWSWRVQIYSISSGISEGGESELGADFIFQIDVSYKKRTLHKLIPVQAKKAWAMDPVLSPTSDLAKENERLLKQAKALCKYFPNEAMIADFQQGKYQAARAEEVLRAHGNFQRMPPRALIDLGKMLGDEFLACNIGTRDARVSDDLSEIVLGNGSRIRILSEHVARLIVTNARNDIPS